MASKLKLSLTADSSLLIVGRITKPQGLRGEVVVYLSTTEEQRISPGTVLSSAGGPLLVVKSRRHQDRFVVTFDGIDTREKADSLRGVELSAEPIEDPDALWVHELIGKQVRDSTGVDRGLVTAVQANPASDLLELEDGLLVPLRFVSEVVGETIFVDTPAGLFDL